MKLGLQIPSFTWPGGPAEIRPTLAEIARTADSVGDHRGRALRRPRLAGDRRRLERGGAPGTRRPVPAARGALRAPGGGPQDHPADVERRRRTVRGQTLQAGPDAQLS